MLTGKPTALPSNGPEGPGSVVSLEGRPNIDIRRRLKMGVVVPAIPAFGMGSREERIEWRGQTPK